MKLLASSTCIYYFNRPSVIFYFPIQQKSSHGRARISGVHREALPELRGAGGAAEAGAGEFSRRRQAEAATGPAALAGGRGELRAPALRRLLHRLGRRRPVEPHARIPGRAGQGLLQRQHPAAGVLQRRAGEGPPARVGQAAGERAANGAADCQPRPEQGHPAAQSLVPAARVYGSLHSPGAPQVPD